MRYHWLARSRLLLFLLIALLITYAPQASATRTEPSSRPAQTFLVQSITPNQGVNTLPTSVTITGSGFSTAPPPTVRLVGTAGVFPLTPVVAQNSTTLTTTVPAGLTPGIYDLSVISGGRTSILASAFIVLSSEPPLIDGVQPDAALNDRASELIVQGTNFYAGAVVMLGGTELATTRVNIQSLLATVPEGLTPGRYSVTVKNLDGGEATLADAFTVINASGLNDDLSSSNDLLWINPQAPRATVPFDLGLLVQRRGGRNALDNVLVEFRRDAPDGEILGSVLIPFLDPRSEPVSTPGLPVTFANAGVVTIYAIIDPNNEATEDDEDNNIYSRTIVVGDPPPPAVDQIPPTVDGITINDGSSDIVTDPNINVDIQASDNQSGVPNIYMIEYAYFEGTGRWVPIAQSGWLPFGTSPQRYLRTLMPQSGMRYIQVRARDGAGNISIGQARRLINYEAPSDSIGRGQTRIYRYELAAGQSFEVNVDVLSGDADLYVWSSRTDQSARVSNLPGSADERVRIEAAQIVPGLYQVEVFGYTAATYRITTTIGDLPASASAQQDGGIDPLKDLPTAPLVGVTSIPSEQAGNVPPPPTDTVTPTPTPTPTSTPTPTPTSTPTPTPVTGNSVYLPLVRR